MKVFSNSSEWSRKSAGVTLNLGTGKGASVLDLIAMVEHVGGRIVPTVKAPRRAGDPPILVASPECAQRLLRWEPAYSALQDIVESAWRWHAQAYEDFSYDSRFITSFA